MTDAENKFGDTYEEMALGSLKDFVISLLKEKRHLEESKKEYVAGVRESLKEIDSKLEAAMYWIGRKEGG